MKSSMWDSYGSTADDAADAFTVMASGIPGRYWGGVDLALPSSQSISVEKSKPKPRDVIDELRSSVSKWLDGAITA